jgi:hypothetical protein
MYLIRIIFPSFLVKTLCYKGRPFTNKLTSSSCMCWSLSDPEVGVAFGERLDILHDVEHALSNATTTSVSDSDQHGYMLMMLVCW